MPTHAIRFAEQADEIIIMKKGRIVRKGHFKEINNSAEYQ
jgi:ABC-type multidrug transport system ATPase subunit